jgi:pimeloyl-ACP methyl ester carboxylesterase
MVQTTTLRVHGLSIEASAAGNADKPGLILLHGWPQSRALYDGVIDQLSVGFFVLAMDLPEIGGSRGAPASAEKTVLADIVLAAAERAEARDITFAGVDVGGMIAFAAARDHGLRIKRAIVMNTVIPGLDPWEQLLADPRVWHFAFHAIPDLPETLVSGHEHAYFDFFHNVLAGDPKKVTEAMREAFANAYRRPEALKAGFDWYRAMAQDANHNANRKPITTPIAYVRGDALGRSSDDYVTGLKAAGAESVEVRVVRNSGELIPIEAPEAFVDLIKSIGAAI